MGEPRGPDEELRPEVARAPGSGSRFSTFIRAHKHDILADWVATVCRVPVAARLDRPALIDHIPDLLERIAEMADELAAGSPTHVPAALADLHALERLDEGFDLSQVVSEFSALRDCILRLWSTQTASGDVLGTRALHQAIDRAVGASVHRYTIARDRTLMALDRISAAALEIRSLDDLLDQLLRVLLETTAAVDTAALLLREGDVLRVRAAVGLEEELRTGWSVRIGEGIAGLIAASGHPIAVESAATDPRVRSPSLRANGVKGLVGVPLIEGGEVIGVAQMGSRTAATFSIQDRRLFTALATRATSAISLHVLREREHELRAQAEARQAELEAVIESLPDAVFIGTDAGIRRANRAALELADWHDGELERPLAELADDLEARDAETGAPIAEDERPFFLALRGQPTTREVVLRNRKTGREVVARASAAPIRQGDRVIGAVAVNTDITDKRRTQAAIEGALRLQHAARAEAERTLAVIDTILATSSVGIAFIDAELRYVRINEALAAINGLPAAQHLGRTVREVVGDPAADFLEPLLRRILETRAPVEQLELELAPRSTPDQVRTFVVSYVPVVTAAGFLLGIGAVVIEVTDRRRMERELRERELQFRSVADNMPQLAWMGDETGSLTWYNRRWYEYTGTTWEATRGWGWQAAHHPDHVERVLGKFRRHLASGEVWEDTFPLRGADGRYRWFLSRAVPIRDETGRVVRWFGTNTDVTEQRFMHDATQILSSSLDYRETFARVAELAVPALADWCAIDVVEEAGVIRVAVAHTDPAKVELARELASRYPPDWKAPRGLANVIRTGKSEHILEIPDELLVESARDPEHLRLARELGLRSLVMAPLVARDRTLGAISLVFAESQRRYAPADIALIEELGRRIGLAIDNARLYAEAQRQSRMREELLAVVSHDLKNPLYAIHLSAALLLGKAEPRSRKHLEVIQRSASRMDHLLGDLLDVAVIQAGHLAIELEPADAQAILREAFEAHEPMAREKDIHLVHEASLDGATMRADRQRILQVFANLLGNAIKFCGAGDTITIRGAHRGTFLEFSVADTGPGIPDDDLPHVFEPYWSAKKFAKKGTGLGLYISRGIVEAHGGRIWAESTLGKGTTFYFTIPLGLAEPAPAST